MERDTGIDELAQAARTYTRAGHAWARESGGEIDGPAFVVGAIVGAGVASLVVWVICLMLLENLLEKLP